MYKSIILPVDLGEDSSWTRALPVAAKIAEDYGATLHIVNVVPDYGMPVVGSFFPEDFEKKALAAAKQKLKELTEKHAPAGVKIVPHVSHGSIYKEIMRAADKLGCDLIVLSSHRPEMKDYMLGPNAARVARHARQSVMIVRN